ncbi:MAG TPA: hypothetical protein VLE19_17515, partial [Pyrinomonadaceae bacterium]|nr:hypothetical protein [Pyrinomonadaceae bacterium]
MTAPPRLTKLGAKWVEVTNGGTGHLIGRGSELKTWPATPVERVARSRTVGDVPWLSLELLPFIEGSSRGRSAIHFP